MSIIRSECLYICLSHWACEAHGQSESKTHFSTLSHERHDFRGGGELSNIKYVLIFSTNFGPKHFRF